MKVLAALGRGYCFDGVAELCFISAEEISQNLRTYKIELLDTIKTITSPKNLQRRKIFKLERNGMSLCNRASDNQLLSPVVLTSSLNIGCSSWITFNSANRISSSLDPCSEGRPESLLMCFAYNLDFFQTSFINSLWGMASDKFLARKRRKLAILVSKSAMLRSFGSSVDARHSNFLRFWEGCVLLRPWCVKLHAYIPTQ